MINLIKEIVAQNSEEVKSKGEKAFSLLMGKVMERVRGRAEGKKVAELIRKVMKDETG